MLYSLLTSLTENYSFLNLFKYITFRTGLSVVTSFMIVFTLFIGFIISLIAGLAMKQSEE